MAPFDQGVPDSPRWPGSTSQSRGRTLSDLLHAFLGARDTRGSAPSAEKLFKLDYKLLGLAVGLEVAVAGLQYHGGWLMAAEYGSTNPVARDMMMLAPSLYFIAELTRVPLALAFRLHPSRMLKAALLVFAVASAVITVKSASQIGEQMYRPRFYQVREAQHDLALAVAAEQAQTEKLRSADGARKAVGEEVTAAQRSLDDARLRLAGLPPTTCSPMRWFDREGRERRDRRCTTDPRTQPLVEALKTAEAKHAAAIAAEREATAAWSAMVDLRPAANAAVADASAKLARAIMHSQIHSFTGMLFRKSAEQASEAEIYTFLQIFVFVPAVVVSLAGFVLTCASVQRRTPTHITLSRRVAKEIGKYAAS